MSIRTRLIISYLAVIICLSGGYALFVHFYISGTLLPQNIDVANRCVHNLAEANSLLTRELITRAGEALVASRSEAAAHEIAFVLHDIPRPLDFDVLRDNPRVRAVATEPIMFGTNAAQVGHLVLLSTNGTAIIHPDRTFEGSRFFEESTNYAELTRVLADAAQTGAARGYYDFPDPATGSDRRKFMAVTRIADTPFMVGASVFIDDFYRPIQRAIVEFEQREQQMAEAKITALGLQSEMKLGLNSLVVLAVLSVLALGFGLVFARSIAQPISCLRTAVQRVGGGDFSACVIARGPPEVKQLATAFNSMGDELRRYMRELEQEITTRETFESEIRIAREIQESLVPRTFPPFPHRREFDLHAILEPARDVAGDLYDFFFVDDDTLVVIVGDVSGKSVPAAFFMAITRTVLRGVCMQERDPARVLEHANSVLVEDNDACMFVTLFLGLYDVPSGTLTFANAGHHHAYTVAPDGELHAFGLLGDPPLGLLPKHTYRTAVEHVPCGHTLFIFTDGVNEAHSPEFELYGTARLENVLRAAAGTTPCDLCARVATDLDAHQQGAVFDDITLLVLKNRLTSG